MKSVLCLLLVTLFFTVAIASLSNTDVEILKKFNEFEVKFNKNYDSPAERFHRISVFAENLERVRKMNVDHGTPVFGVTKFMDLTPEEFEVRYTNLRLPEVLPSAPKAVASTRPADSSSWDWGVNKSVITPVKNQEQCGSCWAFSATESTESAIALATGVLPILAPQQIVDCDTSGIDDGCNGGYPYDAFKYIISAGGLELESDYPYQGVQGACQFNPAYVNGTITSWNWVSQDASQEPDMVNYVTNSGPVSVCVDASQWQYYTGGVLQSCTQNIDHAVQATGFGVDPSTGLGYWNVRNSWGTDWGLNGYIWLQRDVNMCAIATIVTAAVDS
jgi:cathepsin F